MRITNREIDPRIKYLRDQGRDVWSISKVDTFHECNYLFYLKYIKKIKDEAGIYGIIGSHAHDVMEMYYNGEIKQEEMYKEMVGRLIETKMSGLKMPATKYSTPEKMMDKWEKAVLHFMRNHKKENHESIIEHLCVETIGKKNAFQGYIDRIDIKYDENGNKYAEIIDWKTSSKSSFDKKARNKKGRQLIIYGVSVESAFKIPVKRIAWNMIKYCDLHFKVKLKSGKLSEKKLTGIDRGEVADKILEKLKKEMGDQDFIIAYMKFDKNEMNFEVFGDTYKYMDFKIEDYIIDHEYSEETKKECKQFIIDTIKSRINKGDDEENYSTYKCNAYATDFDYFGANLCGVKGNCPQFDMWKKLNKNK